MPHQAAKIEFEKLCPICRHVLPLTDFPRNRSKRDGRGDYCLGCTAEYMQKWRAQPENKAAYLASVRNSKAKAREEYAAAVQLLSPHARKRLGLEVRVATPRASSE